MLIYYTLYKSYNQNSNCLLLKTYEFDQLLLNLLDKYPKISDLKQQINRLLNISKTPRKIFKQQM
ncbi:MAG: hypothetical protein BRC38_17220 [Cyanobacteria bacterium QH_6_48_35]|nr:MAG: hypothetical protein BRC38_17220 [Cyanobacteria bacterium QH_6_48_35]